MTIDQLRADAYTGCADTLRKLEDLINRQHQKNKTYSEDD